MSYFCSVVVEPPSKTSIPLTPVHSGEEKCEPESFWGAGVRSYYLIHYVIDGKGVFYCGPHKYTLQKGQLFVIYPGTVVKYQADKESPWHYAWIAFHGDEAMSILDKAGITPKNPVLTPQNGEEILDILRQMPHEHGADLESNLRFAARLYDFLSLLIPNTKGDQKRENAYYTAAVRYIKAHYAEDITVESIAAQIGISRKYLFAIFKKILGSSPKEYMINIRIKQAKELLANPELPLGKIAYSVGYKDALTFSKVFKQKTGLSPSAYRNALLDRN